MAEEPEEPAEPSNDDVQAIFAANVEKYRKRAKLSQEKLSKNCGLHISYVGRLERTPGNPQLSTMKLLADKLGVTVIDLLSAPRRRKR
jgi:transcriptional regulator with XRE-family HTH domain